MAIEQIAVVVVQVHAAAEAVAEHPAIGALPAAGPFAVAERFEAVLPDLPETVAVDIALVEIGPHGSTPRNGTVDPDGSDRHPGRTLVELVADLGFVTAQKPLARITCIDAPLLPDRADELQHLAELRVGHAQGRVLLGPAHGKDRKQAPRTHPLGNQHIAELGQERH